MKSDNEMKSKSDNGIISNPRHSLKTPSLRLCNFFSKKNFDTEFEISLFGTMDISPYTQSEQPRVAGKHSTRLEKNSMAVVTYIATLFCGPPSFW